MFDTQDSCPESSSIVIPLSPVGHFNPHTRLMGQGFSYNTAPCVMFFLVPMGGDDPPNTCLWGMSAYRSSQGYYVWTRVQLLPLLPPAYETGETLFLHSRNNRWNGWDLNPPEYVTLVFTSLGIVKTFPPYIPYTSGSFGLTGTRHTSSDMVEWPTLRCGT